MAAPPRNRPVAVPPALPFSTDRHTLRIPANATTLQGFRDWATSNDFPEHVRATFLGGEILVDRSNEEPKTHGLVKGEISRVLLGLVRETETGVFFPDSLLVTNVDAEISNNPDLCTCRGDPSTPGVPA